MDQFINQYQQFYDKMVLEILKTIAKPHFKKIDSFPFLSQFLVRPRGNFWSKL